MRELGVLLSLVFLAACGDELGACDIESARRVVYDGDGTPAFEGQALMIGSCGWGAFCHSEAIPLANRYGAPFGLDYDLSLAAYNADAEVEETERLRVMQRRAFEHRHAIWSQVVSGGMPIRRPEVVEGAPSYHRLDLRTGLSSAMPSLETPQGQESLRNWLACELPVVERTASVADTQAAAPEVGYVVPSQEVDPLLPEWNDIYERMIVRRCNSSDCHGVGAAGSLDLRGGDADLPIEVRAATALEVLRAGEASGPEDCGLSAAGVALLVPGDPDASLLYQKLRGIDAAGEPVCGDAMPIGGRISDASLMAIGQWILELPE